MTRNWSKFVVVIILILANINHQVTAVECKLQGVSQGALGSKMADIYSVRYPRDGLAATRRL